MAESIPILFDAPRTWDLIVPMPSAPHNYARRLFNPSRCLGETVGKLHSIPLATGLLRHLRTGHSQAAQNQHQRLKHARSSLQSTGATLKGQSILLLDDVVTTGATSIVAADLLRQQGAGRIDLLSLARAESWHPAIALNKNHT